MNWPEHLLPRPSENYSAQVDPVLARTEFEVGFRQRRKFTGVEERISVDWMVTQLQLDIMESFIQVNMSHGASAVEMTIIGVDGIRRETVRILGGATSKAYLPGGSYRVSATLIAEPKATADAEIMAWLLYLEDGSPDGFMQVAEILALYTESFYGVATESPEITEFMSLYS